ncbi:MAG: glycine betaine/L-proline ABC transporter substrate-binding protein ProX [Desulfobacteraceae bacterium]
MQRFKITLMMIAAGLVLTAAPAMALNMTPGKGTTVRPARATWNTGFFQEALVRRGLEELGYNVKRPKDLQNPIFLSKREVDKYHIVSLDDFKRDEVRKAFDTNGDGKADLTACPPGWGCENVIAWHMKAYNLKNDIHPIKAAYEAGMASALGAYKSGDPIFFYTWAPNWTIFKLKPGKDVMWINVPEIIPKDSQKSAVDRMTVSGVQGAVTDPVKLGFVVSDIRIVANKKFIKKNPAAKKFFEILTLPLNDINEQNTRMYEGEKSQKDIERHVDDWIAKNKAEWNGWLQAAREAAANN